jgi:hypothetical protein
MASQTEYVKYMANMAQMYGMEGEELHKFKEDKAHDYAMAVRKKLEEDDQYWLFQRDMYLKWRKEMCQKKQKEDAIMERIKR